MMKFKKFCAKALAFAMVMGTMGIHTIHMGNPVTVMAAASTKLTLTTDNNDTVGQGQSIQITPEWDGDAGTVTWAVGAGTADGISVPNGLLTVPADIPVGTKITVTATSTNPSLTASIDITVTKKQTARFDLGDGFPSLRISGLNGHYISIAYYSDKEGKKLKSTYVYTSDEMGSCFSLAGLNLKKGASFRVYDEVTDIDDVHLVVVDDASEKISVKVKDFTKDKLWEVLEIKVGSKVIGESDWATYADKLCLDNGLPLSETNPEEILKNLKVNARATGMTYYLTYTESDTQAPSQAKFKISAATKAPKVTVDYVNGTYTIAKNAYYTTVNVDENGCFVIPETPLTKAEDKVVMSIDQVINSTPALYDAVDSSATFDANEIYYILKHTYTQATVADSDAFAAGEYYTLSGTTYTRAANYVAGTTYYEITKSEYEKDTTVTKDNFDSKKSTLYTECQKTVAGIIAQSPAKGSKMESLMAVYKVEKLQALSVDYSADKKTATYSCGTGTDKKEVAKLEFSDTGVKISASKDISYYDASGRTPKWVTLKATKSTTKEIPLTGDEVLKFKLLGTKATRDTAAAFGSPETTTINVYLDSKPVEVIEQVTNITDSNKVTGVTYYSDEKCETVATPTATAANYYVKATYTLVPDTVTTPTSGTKYYTTTNKKTFTEAANLTQFAEGTIYYTRTAK